MEKALQSPFLVMAKPRGAVCNLNCAYCFYLEKANLYPDSSMRMSDRILEEYIRQYIRSQPTPEITFAWQGGEPVLMGIEFYERVVELQVKYCPPGVKVLNTLQTNGTLLDERLVKFFKQNQFLLGVSMDGPRELHDAYRLDKGGQGSFDRVMAGIHLLQRHEVDYNILACVNSLNARYPLEVYRFLRDEVGAQFIQLIPIVEKVPRASQSPKSVQSENRQEAYRVHPRSVSGQAYGTFLTSIFDEWVQFDVGRVYIQIIESALSVWAGYRSGFCVFDKVCGRGLALEHNGDLYACDHFVDPAHRLGNILEIPLSELAGLPQQIEFGMAKVERLPAKCRQCKVQFICNGGCPKDRFTRQTGSTKEPLNYLCEGYLSFFTHIFEPMRVMAALLTQQKPPSMIMEILAFERAVGQAGPKGLCPCGSNRLVSDCHPQVLHRPILAKPKRSAECTRKTTA